MFYDRIDAGQKLAFALRQYKRKKNTVVIALPKGGVILGYAIANELHLPLDMVMVKKIGYPSNPNFIIGAVSMTGKTIDVFAKVDSRDIEKTTKIIQEQLKKNYQMYYGDTPPLNLKNKTVIVVDDGVETGRSMIVALELIIKKKPEQIIVAIPVGPTDTIKEIENYSDKVICLQSFSPFYSIGNYYKDYSPIKDKEIKLLLSMINNHADTSYIK